MNTLSSLAGNPNHSRVSEMFTTMEEVRGSPFPVRLMFVELFDGVYAPLGLRLPEGKGPFPLIVFASGNGGMGMEWVRQATQNRSWTQERFLEAGYAVAWMRYRAEVDYAYDKIGRLVEDRRQGRQLLNRGPLEYEDVISIVEHLKTLPEIDAERIGYVGMSHGGEMALKIASEYGGIAAMVASEPASHEFLRLRPDVTAHVNPETGLLNVEKMMMTDAAKVRPRITEDVARARFGSIETPILVHGRDPDELQGIFRVSYDLLHELGKDAEWISYDHPEHGFIYPARDATGEYTPDSMQIRAVDEMIDFFRRKLKG